MQAAIPPYSKILRVLNMATPFRVVRFARSLRRRQVTCIRRHPPIRFGFPARLMRSVPPGANASTLDIADVIAELPLRWRQAPVSGARLGSLRFT
jgi:hypothetical protein